MFIDKRDLKNHRETNFPYLEDFSQTVWNLLSAIYESNWDKLKIDNKNQSFRQNILAQFNKNKQANFIMISNKTGIKLTDKPVEFSNLPALVRLSTSFT